MKNSSLKFCGKKIKNVEKVNLKIVLFFEDFGKLNNFEIDKNY